MRSFMFVIIAGVAAVCVGLAATNGSSKVTYIPADQVSAALGKGAVLLNNGTYQVHASRRDAEGQVEVHVKDADIIYMLSGSTTFVTGGTVVGGQTTAPDEIRGTSVDGGEIAPVDQRRRDRRSEGNASLVQGSQRSGVVLRCEGSLAGSRRAADLTRASNR